MSAAERNKALREGSYGALRCVAIDGWEAFASYDRHCPQCLVRLIHVKRARGEMEKVKQYYHRYVVALLLGPVLDVALAIEPRSMRRRTATRWASTLATKANSRPRRLLDSLHQTYGSFIDAVVVDALYPNGPWMTRLDDYGGFMVLKKENNKPLQEALALWQEGPCESYQDSESQEQIEFWDADEIETLGPAGCPAAQA